MKQIYLKETLKLILNKPRKFNPGVIYQSYGRWVNSIKEKNRSPLSDEQPWMTFEAIAFLDKLVNKTMTGFEYGCGGSTIFLAQRVKHLVSVDHHAEWFKLTSSVINSRKELSWQGALVESTPMQNFDASQFNNPDAYISSAEESVGRSFENYARYIDNYADGYFDFVVVDGRARPSCIKHSLPKVKPGGFLILDNSDRDYYLTGLSRKNLDGNFTLLLDSFGPGPYIPYFWGTTIWQKSNQAK